MTRPGIEPQSPGPLANTLLIRPMARFQALIKAIEANPESSIQRVSGQFSSSQFNVTHHLLDFGKSIRSSPIVPNVIEILLNI